MPKYRAELVETNHRTIVLNADSEEDARNILDDAQLYEDLLEVVDEWCVGTTLYKLMEVVENA